MAPALLESGAIVVMHPLYAFLAPPPGQAGPGIMVFVVQIGALIAIFWFLLLRPQRQQAKQHEEMLKGLKKGDEVVTGGGIIATVVHIKDDRVTVQSGESRFIVERTKIATVVQPKAATEEPAAK